MTGFDPEEQHELGVWAHVVPFVAWLLVMKLLGDPAGWKYAARSAVTLLLILALRPWRWYARLARRNIPWALGIGLFTALIWILPETSWAAHWGSFQPLYLNYGVMPWGRAPDPLENWPYAPQTAGWGYALIRLAGSTLVIAVAEEFFWRGFLYRFAVDKHFLGVELKRFHPGWFLLVALLFGLVHHRWLVGLLAGMLYGILLIRTRDIWAVCIAHGFTNLVLGLYVLVSGAYQFW